MYPFSSPRSQNQSPTRSSIKNENTFFHGDIVPGILKFSICFGNPYSVLETRLLALSTNIAVDSPKHCTGCKQEMIISGCLEPYRFFWGDFATLTRFWRGASGYENSLLEWVPYYNSRFWSANDDSCTLWTELVVFSLVFDRFGCWARKFLSGFFDCFMFLKGSTKSGAKWTLESVPLPPYLLRAVKLPVNYSVAFGVNTRLQFQILECKWRQLHTLFQQNLEL